MNKIALILFHNTRGTGKNANYQRIGYNMCTIHRQCKQIARWRSEIWQIVDRLSVTTLAPITVHIGHAWAYRWLCLLTEKLTNSLVSPLWAVIAHSHGYVYAHSRQKCLNNDRFYTVFTSNKNLGENPRRAAVSCMWCHRYAEWSNKSNLLRSVIFIRIIPRAWYLH